MNRRKLRIKYRRLLRYYDFDLKTVSDQQAGEVLTLLRSAKEAKFQTFV